MIALRGIIHGKTIELAEAPGLAEGQEVEVVVRPATVRAPLPFTPPLNADPDKIADWWTPEDDAIFEEIARYRRESGYRELPE